LRRLRYSDDTCCGTSLQARVAEGSLRGPSGALLPLPPAYAEGATIYNVGGELFIDTRHPRPAPGSGVRLGLYGEFATSTDAGPARRYIRLGIAPELYWDITGQNRVLHLGVNVQVINPRRGDVPFSELIDLSDDGPLKGFLPGRVIGPTAATVTLEYEWPIWIWLDGALHLAAGNAFGAGFDDFAFDAARLSAGLGIRAPDERDHAFNFLIAIGTEPLRDGARVDSLRLVFGGTRVF
jgi:hypothetical protein